MQLSGAKKTKENLLGTKTTRNGRLHKIRDTTIGRGIVGQRSKRRACLLFPSRRREAHVAFPAELRYRTRYSGRNGKSLLRSHPGLAAACKREAGGFYLS